MVHRVQLGIDDPVHKVRGPCWREGFNNLSRIPIGYDNYEESLEEISKVDFGWAK